jgi:hypothetical protein
MGRHYAPLSVFRQLPLELVHGFLARESIHTGDDWASLAEGDARAIHQAWLNLPSPSRERVEQMLRAVHSVATHAAVQALIAEVEHHGRNISDDIALIDGHHAKALWILVNYPTMFHTAHMLLSTAAPYGKYWNLTKGAAGVPYDNSPDARQHLRLSVMNLYRDQGRGQACTVEPIERNGSLYLFLYLDDYTETHVGHNQHGKLERKPLRSAFEVVFVYNPVNGTLDLYAEGTTPLRSALRDRFFKHILRRDTPSVVPGRRSYWLQGLLDRTFPLATDPFAGIHAASVRRLKIVPPQNGRRVTLDADKKGGAADIYDMLDDHFPPARFRRSDLSVCQATFTVSYHSLADGKDRSLTFDVSAPDACNLKSLSEDQRVVGERCLRLWGVLRDDASDDVPRPQRVA